MDGLYCSPGMYHVRSGRGPRGKGRAPAGRIRKELLRYGRQKDIDELQTEKCIRCRPKRILCIRQCCPPGRSAAAEKDGGTSAEENAGTAGADKKDK